MSFFEFRVREQEVLGFVEVKREGEGMREGGYQKGGNKEKCYFRYWVQLGYNFFLFLGVGSNGLGKLMGMSLDLRLRGRGELVEN